MPRCWFAPRDGVHLLVPTHSYLFSFSPEGYLMLHDSDRQMQALIGVKKASSYASAQHFDNEHKRLKLLIKKREPQVCVETLRRAAWIILGHCPVRSARHE